MQITEFDFNPFQENTYIFIDETHECVILDAGCYDKEEEDQLASYIERKQLKPVALLNTHCHVDYIFENDFVFNRYHLQQQIH